MRRKALVAFLGGAVLLMWPGETIAQQAKAPTIGLLVLGQPDPAPFRKHFSQGLRDLGYVEGKTIQLEFRSAGGDPKRLADMAAELVGLKVDVIVAYQTPSVTAAKRATHQIPIVMAPAGAPVETGLIASLARPGGNITGLTATVAELVGKNFELIREVRPSARKVAVLANAADPFSKPFVEQCEVAARTLTIETRVFLIKGPEELDKAFETIAREGSDGVVVQPSLQRRRAAELAGKLGLPAVSPTRIIVEEGGLMSYSGALPEVFNKAAGYVDKILKGAKPADLPVQQPTKFELAINLRTAKALGITIPPALLARADQVIE